MTWYDRKRNLCFLSPRLTRMISGEVVQSCQLNISIVRVGGGYNFHSCDDLLCTVKRLQTFSSGVSTVSNTLRRREHLWLYHPSQNHPAGHSPVSFLGLILPLKSIRLLVFFIGILMTPTKCVVWVPRYTPLEPRAQKGFYESPVTFSSDTIEVILWISVVVPQGFYFFGLNSPSKSVFFFFKFFICCSDFTYLWIFIDRSVVFDFILFRFSAWSSIW